MVYTTHKNGDDLGMINMAALHCFDCGSPNQDGFFLGYRLVRITCRTYRDMVMAWRATGKKRSETNTLSSRIRDHLPRRWREFSATGNPQVFHDFFHRFGDHNLQQIAFFEVMWAKSPERDIYQPHEYWAYIISLGNSYCPLKINHKVVTSTWPSKFPSVNGDIMAISWLYSWNIHH